MGKFFVTLGFLAFATAGAVNAFGLFHGLAIGAGLYVLMPEVTVR